MQYANFHKQIQNLRKIQLKIPPNYNKTNINNNKKGKKKFFKKCDDEGLRVILTHEGHFCYRLGRDRWYKLNKVNWHNTGVTDQTKWVQENQIWTYTR